MLLLIIFDMVTTQDFLSLLLYFFLISFSIIFITYWTFRLYNRNKLGIIFTSLFTIIFLLLCLSPWISDWTFNKNDAREILSEHGIWLGKDIELISNESGGLRDYYHIFEIELSESDYEQIKNMITRDKSYIGNLESDWRNVRHDLMNLDTLNYENQFKYIRDYKEYGKMEDGTFHFVFELSKTRRTLRYIGSNE